MENKHAKLTQLYSSWGDKLLGHLDVLNNIQNNKTFSPVTVQLAPIEACTSMCPFCSVGARPLKSFIPFEKIVKCLTDFRSLGAKSLELTGGGEPLLYRDREAKKTINDIIDTAYDLGFDIGIITNTNKIGKLLHKDRHDKIEWLRISLIKIDEGYDPEDYDFDGFPEEKLGFSYIIYEVKKDDQGKYIPDEFAYRNWTYEGTTPETIRKLAHLVELHPKVKFLRLAGNCLIKGNNNVVQEKYKPLVDEVDKYEKFFLKEIYDNDSPFNDGCYQGAIRPYIAPNPHGGDYQVYICTSHVLNTRTYDLQYSLGSIDDVLGIWQRMNENFQKYGYPYEVKDNSGCNWETSCKFCYYYNNNKLLHTIAQAEHMPNRNFP